MGSFRSYREISKNVNWGSDAANLTLDQINAGSLLRIADSLEIVSKKYSDLESKNTYLSNLVKEKDQEIQSLKNSNKSLRGVITKYKKTKDKDKHT